jgi:ABC-type Na+ transport system ATPase subunit NatA
LTAPNSGMIVVEIFDLTDVDWLYTAKPSVRNIDKVRLLIGDTDSNDQLLTDDEVSWFLEVHGTINRSASEAARAIAAKFARLMNRSIGGLSADFSAKYRQYIELADNLLQREETSPVSPYLSGYKISEKKSVEDDIDREPTFSRKGIMDNNRAYPADNEGWTDYRRTG